jgi:hypothetical protein
MVSTPVFDTGVRGSIPRRTFNQNILIIYYKYIFKISRYNIMSYIFYKTKLYNSDIINIIYRCNKIPDRNRKSLTCDIIKSAIMIRTYLQQDTLTMKKILYSMFFSNIPSAWLINTYSEIDWDNHIKYRIQSFI